MEGWWRRLVIVVSAAFAAGCAQPDSAPLADAGGQGGTPAAVLHHFAWDSGARERLAAVVALDVHGPGACRFEVRMAARVPASPGPFLMAFDQMKGLGPGARSETWAYAGAGPSVHAAGLLDTRTSSRMEGAVFTVETVDAPSRVTGPVVLSVAGLGLVADPDGGGGGIRLDVACEVPFSVTGLWGGSEAVLFDRQSMAGGAGAVVRAPAGGLEASAALADTLAAEMSGPDVRLLADSFGGAGTLTLDGAGLSRAYAMPWPGPIEDRLAAGRLEVGLARAGAGSDSFAGALLGGAAVASLDEIPA